MSPPVPFANVSDPLSAAATLVSCIDKGEFESAEPDWHPIKGATGEHLQSNTRDIVQAGTVRYWALGAVTMEAGGTCNVGGTSVFVIGATMGGSIIRSIKPTGQDQDSHEGVDVTVELHHEVDIETNI